MTLDDALVQDAMKYTGITDKSELLREALVRMVRREAIERLIALGGSAPDLELPPRRRDFDIPED